MPHPIEWFGLGVGCRWLAAAETLAMVTALPHSVLPPPRSPGKRACICTWTDSSTTPGYTSWMAQAKPKKWTNGPELAEPGWVPLVCERPAATGPSFCMGYVHTMPWDGPPIHSMQAGGLSRKRLVV